MNILIVGLGSIARKHIAAIRAIEPDAAIFALRSKPDAPAYENVTNISEPGDAGVEFDFAIISNPTSCHAATIEALMPLRIPLFIEKPVFESTIHKELAQRAEQAGIITYVACNLRFLDSIVFLHDYVRSTQRRINEVNVYCGSYLPEWRPGTDFRKCYSAIPELGGGANIDLIHDIDYTYWIFGRPIASRGLCRAVSSLGIRAIDYARYELIYPQFVAGITLNYYRRDYKRTIEILFDDDTWTADLKLNVITDSRGDTIFQGKNTPLETYEAQLRYFIRCLRDGIRPENDIATATEVLGIALAYSRDFD